MFLVSGRNSAVDVPDLQLLLAARSDVIFYDCHHRSLFFSAWRLKSLFSPGYGRTWRPSETSLVVAVVFTWRTEVLADELKSFPKVLQKMRGCERWAYLVSCPRFHGYL